MPYIWPGLEMPGFDAFAVDPGLFYMACVFVVLVGAVLGSFAGALIYRIPENLTWSSLRPADASARSRCVACGAVLRAVDLAPVLSWLLLRGRCRYCEKAISPVYPLAELICALACLGVYLCWGLGGAGVVMMCAMPLLVALAVIDIRHMILPDILIVLLAGAGILFRLLGAEGAYISALLDGAAGAVLAGGMVWALGAGMRVILKKDALGFGDVKFFAVAGLWLGIGALPVFMVMAGCFGVIWGAVSRIIGGNGYFPFGPALIIGFYGTLLLKSPALGVGLW